MYPKHPRSKGRVICYEGRSYVHLLTCYRRLTINVLYIKRHKSRIYILNSVQNKEHTLCELKNIYFEFQLRIPQAMGLDVAPGQNTCFPAIAIKKPRNEINVLGSVIHKSSLPQMLLLHAESSSISSHTVK